MPTARNTTTIPLGLWKLFALTRDDEEHRRPRALKRSRRLPHAERIVDMLRDGCDDSMLI
jgi:hypothetical protein